MNNIRFTLLFFFVALLVSCGTARRSIVSNDGETALSVSDQRKYEYYFFEAIRLEHQERYDEAFEMLQYCLAICPTASSAQYKLSSYYFAMGQKEKAAQALLRAVEGERDNYWYRQTLAIYYQGNLEYDKAIAVIEEMQTLFPKRNGELLPALINLYNHTGQYTKVIETLARLELITGKSEAISMEKMRNYLLMGNQDAAFGEVEALVSEYPDNSYYRVVLAEVYLNNGHASEAKPILLDILVEEPDNGPAKIALAQYYKQVNDSAHYLAMTDSIMMSSEVNEDFKIRLMAQLIKENTDSTFLMELFERTLALPQQSANLGHLCVQYMLSISQPEDRVRPILLQMLKIEPDHIPARSQLLAYAASRNDMEEVVRLCSEGIDYTPEVLPYYYYKGIGLSVFLGRHEEALETYRQAIRQITEESEVAMVGDIYTAMGDLLYNRGETVEAYDCYDKALQYNPSNILVLNNYAYFLAEEDTLLEKAEQMSRRAIEIEPNNATYLDTYAWILYKLQRYEEAFTYIEQALAVEIEPSDVLYRHAGDICDRLGKKEQALKYWRKALDLQREVGEVDKHLEENIRGMK